METEMIIGDPRRMTSGLLLAGGRAQRMGGEDKGLISLGGKPLVRWGLEGLHTQVSEVLISANRNQARYEALGVPVISDSVGGFAGPLAGFLSGLSHVSQQWMITAPCDSPLLFRNYVRRMCSAISDHSDDVAVAHDGNRLQPVFTLLHVRVYECLKDFLVRGERKIDKWLEEVRWKRVDFSDCPRMFLNANTPEDLESLQKLVRDG